VLNQVLRSLMMDMNQNKRYGSECLFLSFEMVADMSELEQLKVVLNCVYTRQKVDTKTLTCVCTIDISFKRLINGAYSLSCCEC
jgi:hypothetical protein